MNRGMFAIVSASALVLGLHAAPAFAQHGQGASAHPPQGSAHATTTHGSSSHTTTTTTHGSSTRAQSTTHGSSTHGSTTHAATTHGQSGTTHGSSAHGSTTTHDSGHAKTSSKTAKATTATKSTKTTTATTSTSSSGATTATTLTPVQQKLAKNTNLASKLQSRLPAGTDLQTAAAGFRNLGQFVAAVNVSNNLGIPFSQLKTDMVTKNMSLGQSIQDLRPTASSTIEAQHAEYEAQELITQTTTSTTTTTTSTSTSTSKPKKHGGDR